MIYAQSSRPQSKQYILGIFSVNMIYLHRINYIQIIGETEIPKTKI